MFGDQIDRFTRMSVLGVPLGGGVYLAAAQGLSKTLLEFLAFLRLPPVVTGLTGAWAVNNVALLRRVLGSVGSYDLSKIMIMQGVNSQFDVSGMIERMLGRIEEYIPETITGGETTGLPAPRLPVGALQPVGQVPREPAGPNIDIYDEYMDQAAIT